MAQSASTYKLALTHVLTEPILTLGVKYLLPHVVAAENGYRTPDLLKDDHSEPLLPAEQMLQLHRPQGIQPAD